MMDMFGDGNGGNDEFDDPIRFPREKYPPELVGDIHRFSDLDSAFSSQHHTLGSRRNQSSPGDHTHNGGSSKALGIWQTYPVVWSSLTGAAPAINSGAILGRYMQIGGTLFGRLTFAAGGTTNFGGNDWAFSLPPVPIVPVSGWAGNVYEGGVGVALASNSYGGSPVQATSSYRGVVAANLWANYIQILSDNMYWGGGGGSPWVWSTTSGFSANYMAEVKSL